ncbi:MAG: gliding motility-associated C-terminal domain-containing protein [Chitinophagales bacterium]
MWQDGSTNQNYIVNDTGIYHVTVTTNCNSSSDTVNIYSTICDCEFQIPNAFTPNNDGTNDFFGVVNDCGKVSNFQLQIFNRWGELLFVSNDEKVKWNGDYKNQTQPVDDYVFILQYIQNNNNYFKKGTFSLLK